jgi:hypothetical protein
MMLCTLILTSAAYGDDFTLTPSISLEQKFKDNVLLESNSGDTLNDSILKVSPSLLMQERTQRLYLDISGGLSRYYYRDNPQFETTDKTLSSSLSYRLSELSDLSLRAAYRDDSQPDSDIAQAGLALGTSERIAAQYSFTWAQSFTEKTSWQVNLSRNEETFKKPDEVDNNTTSVNFALSRNMEDLLENTSVSVEGGFQRVDFTKSIEDHADTTSISLGMHRDITQTVSAEFSLGVQSSVSTFDTWFLPAWHERDQGMIGQFLLKEKLDNGERSLSLSHNIGVNSGSSGLVNRTSAGVRFTRRFTEELSASLSCDYFLNRSGKATFTTSNIDEQSIRINPGFFYRFNESWQGNANYEYINIHDDLTSSVTRGSTASMGITYRFNIVE